jgi:alpha(1,3/1,4) fucosyltransferase
MGIGIYIDPPSPILLRDRFFEPATGRLHSSMPGCLAFVKATFEAQGVPVHTADRLPAPNGSDLHLYVSVGNHANYPDLLDRPDVILSAFIVAESPVVEPRIFRGLKRAKRHFKRIFSCVDRLEVTRFAGVGIDSIPLRWPIDYRGVDLSLWSKSDRKFLVMINMNKLPRLASCELYTERLRGLSFFSRTGEIDLYGVDWDKAPRRMGYTRVPWTLRRMHIAYQDWVDKIHPQPWMVAARKVYKGELETKWETLAGYDFALCFENAALKGWLTEKLFECLRVGTIPIYWGATDIEELVPPDCFIDMRQFADYAELRARLKALDPKAVRRYREAGRAFLESDAFEPYSREHFLKIFWDLIKEDAAVHRRI